MKAVVVIPPVFDFYYTPHRSSGLGAEVVLSLLLEKGWQARLLHFPLQSKKGVMRKLPPALGYLKPYLVEGETGKLSYFNKYKRFGPSLDECAARALDGNPELVFISCFAFCYANAAVLLAEQLRKTGQRPLIICGGAGVSAYPEYFMRNSAIDFAFTGEAEAGLPLFLDMMASDFRDFSQVPNLFYKNNAQIVVPDHKMVTDAEEIDFVINKTLETPTSIIYSTTLSRGCPKACRFCSNYITHGRDFRTIPFKIITKTLNDLDKDQITSEKQVVINFEDDNFLCDPDYFFSILDLFKSVFPKVGFLAENGIDYTLITPDILKKLIQYGMKQFNLSMMSVDTHLLNHENRSASRRLYESITNVLKEHNIPCITYFICGLKNDSRDKVIDTLVYLAGQPTRVGISLFYPVPGIPDFENKTFFDGVASCTCAGASAYPWNQSLSTAEMITAFRLARFVNLLKSDRRTEYDEKLIEKSIREQALYTLIRRGQGREVISVPEIDDEMVRLFFSRCPKLF